MQKLLIKCLSEIIKKEKRVPHMLAPRGRCPVYSKVYSDVTERWLLTKRNKLYITYLTYKFQIQY